MSTSNYFSGIVKILENPQVNLVDDSILFTTFRGELTNFKQNKIITVNFWGNLAEEAKKMSHTNDYMIIEGYISIRTKKILLPKNQQLKILTLTGLKIYPFYLTSNPLIERV